MSLRIAIVGYGKMGRSVERLAPEHGCEVVRIFRSVGNRNGAALTQESLAGADVAIVATERPEYRSLTAEDFVRTMRRPRVIDQNWFLAGALSGDPRITYLATGRRGAKSSKWT